MWNDPIVEETRKIRDELAARFNYDVRQIGRYYQSKQSADDRKIVRRPPRKEKKQKAA
jgi:hypothetical protein